MAYAVTAIVLKSMMFAQLASTGVTRAQSPALQPAAISPNSSASIASLPPLPALPKGKSTVIGGAIRSVDAVRDQLTLKIFDGRSMKILFDERTQIFRDGKRVPLRDLSPEDHASVQTTLDGTSVFAVSIHILSQAPEGEMQGQVVSYDPANGDLTIRDTLSDTPMKIRVAADTTLTNIGQAGTVSKGDTASSLSKGSLVFIDFQASNDGRGVAKRIEVLATPGSAFVFSGNITSFDVHAGHLAIIDPRDNKSYSISFDPSRFPISRSFEEGTHVRATATFDGERYVASAISIE